jgi:hypothetical protein
MSVQVLILKNEKITNKGFFDSMEEAQAWLSNHEGMSTFGQKRQVISHPAISTEAQVEISPAVIDEDGVEISPAQFETQVTEIPAREEIIEGYMVEIQDISAQLEQEDINAAALKLLAESDWKILRHLREQALGIPTSLSSSEYLALEQERADAAARIIN